MADVTVLSMGPWFAVDRGGYIAAFAMGRVPLRRLAEIRKTSDFEQVLSLLPRVSGAEVVTSADAETENSALRREMPAAAYRALTEEIDVNQSKTAMLWAERGIFYFICAELLSPKACYRLLCRPLQPISLSKATSLCSTELSLVSLPLSFSEERDVEVT